MEIMMPQSKYKRTFILPLSTITLLALDNLFLFPLQGPASSPSDGLADLLKMGAGIAQGLMAIFNNKVNFLVSLLSDKVMVYTIHKQW